MTLTYAGDYSTNLEKVRFHIQDTTASSGPKPGGNNFTDEEINPIVTAQGSWQKAVGVMFDVLASAWSSYANTQVGPRREDFSKVAEAYADRARQWRDDQGITTTGSSTVGSHPVTRQDGYSDDYDSVET